jgi:hypothetical membrane protein
MHYQALEADVIRRFAGFLAMALPVWFTAIYFLVSSLRNDYRHFNMAISELGSMGTPNALLWNLLGYIASGGVIFYLGWVSRNIQPKSKLGLIVAGAIATSGMMMLLSGVFPGDFENRTSTTMILHTIASILGYLFFLIGGFGLLKISAKSEIFKGVHYFLFVTLLLSIVTGFIRYGDLPGLGQRITFACYFIWTAIFGWAVFKSDWNRSL